MQFQVQPKELTKNGWISIFASWHSQPMRMYIRGSRKLRILYIPYLAEFLSTTVNEDMFGGAMYSYGRNPYPKSSECATGKERAHKKLIRRITPTPIISVILGSNKYER